MLGTAAQWLEDGLSEARLYLLWEGLLLRWIRWYCNRYRWKVDFFWWLSPGSRRQLTRRLSKRRRDQLEFDVVRQPQRSRRFAMWRRIIVQMNKQGKVFVWFKRSGWAFHEEDAELMRRCTGTRSSGA